jgi:ribosomal protein S27AE
MTLTAPLYEVDTPVAKPRISWVELSCLNCGELAGYIENGRIVKPVVPGRVLLHARRLNCGRCGGLLLSGERGTATSVAAIG